VQDEMSQAVTIAIAPAIAEAERQRAMRKPPDSLDAWAAYQRGLWHLNQYTPEDTLVAAEFFQRAIVLDPSFAGGYRGLSVARLIAAADFQLSDLDEALNASERLNRDAIARDGTDSEARAQLSNIYRIRGQFAIALAEAENALATTPSLALAHRARGCALIFSGDQADGIAAVETGLRLEPCGMRNAAALNWIILGLYLSGKYTASVDAARRVIQSYPKYAPPYRWLAAALGQLDRTAEAKQALDEAVTVAPASFDMYVKNRVPWMRPEDHAHMVDGLRKAGWEG
jgi:adenylate cyclase